MKLLSRRIVPALMLLSVSAAAAHADLIHRYSFTDLKDSVGKVDATLKGDAKIADGKLVLANADKTSDDAKLSYLEFAGPILPKSGSVSLAFWFTIKETGNFARLLNIAETAGGSGSAFIYFTPNTAESHARAAISATDTASKTFVDGEPLNDGKPHAALIVIDGTHKKLSFYVDGKPVGTPEDLGDNTLEKVKSLSNWIGKSSFDADTGLSGSIDEFRVYDTALTADQAAAVAKAGPDTVAPMAAPATQPAKP